MEKFKQWHETKQVEENGIVSLIKEHIPNSYEVRNEISWLTNSLFTSLDTFRVPQVKSASVEEGYIKMEYIDVGKQPTKEKVLAYLIESASELHSLIRTDQPSLRTRTNTRTNASEYNSYVRKFTENRIEKVSGEFNLDKGVSDWMLAKIDKLATRYFSIVHRDLRLRHLLIPEVGKPTLIDWEYSNISDPAQDLAKLIYDCVVQHGMDKECVLREVVDKYAHNTKASRDELEQRVSTFLPIIPLEHCAVFVKRKPNGYESEVQKDLAFIFSLYEEEK